MPGKYALFAGFGLHCTAQWWHWPVGTRVQAIKPHHGRADAVGCSPQVVLGPANSGHDGWGGASVCRRKKPPLRAVGSERVNAVLTFRGFLGEQVDHLFGCTWRWLGSTFAMRGLKLDNGVEESHGSVPFKSFVLLCLYPTSSVRQWLTISVKVP